MSKVEEIFRKGADGECKECVRRFCVSTMKELIKSWIDAIRLKIKRYDDTHNFTCDVCGREVFEGERVCSVCMPLLPWNKGAICPFCGRKVGEAGACLDCKEKPLEVAKARSCFIHEGEGSRLVVRYKRGERYLYRTLADLATPLVTEEFSEAEILTFVPMTEKSRKQRGYNQSELLAGEIAERVNKPLFRGVAKKRETKPQKELGRKERGENLKGCFHVTHRAEIKGKRVLIVDDTLTTGATSDELASVLKKAGASKVFLLTITSVPRKNPFGIPPAQKKFNKN